MKRIVLFICLAAMVSGVGAATKYRNFTSAEGKTIRGCIKAYDVRTKTVTFERSNKRTARVPITIFSEDDQAYIREWEVLRNFKLKSSLKISATRKRRENKEKSSSVSAADVEVVDTWYEILLDNRTLSKFKGLNLEYCIYYAQEQGKSRKQGVYCGEFTVDSIAPSSRKTHLTEAVSIFKLDLDDGYYFKDGSDTSQSGKIHGIWIRVHLKSSSGQKLTRELCIPDNLNRSRNWATSSIKAGIN